MGKKAAQMIPLVLKAANGADEDDELREAALQVSLLNFYSTPSRAFANLMICAHRLWKHWCLSVPLK